MKTGENFLELNACFVAMANRVCALGLEFGNPYENP